MPLREEAMMVDGCEQISPSSAAHRRIETGCCIAGGGPAGLMLGYLLARAGAEVTVLEKHDDFLRDFRGDTIHPSTLDVMHELGLLDDFLKLPHSKLYQRPYHMTCHAEPQAKHLIAAKRDSSLRSE